LLKKLLEKHWRKIALSISPLLLLAIFLPQVLIARSAAGRIFQIENVPAQEIGIVFGAGIWRNQRPSAVLADRLKVAARLFHAGKIEKILMTGDNSTFDHHEPAVMKKFAVSLGVPPEKIFLDHAGFRTFDSCARAAKIFGVESAILVSQDFHLPRAIFLCENFSIASFGVGADLQNYRNSRHQHFREFFAKVVAFFEAKIFRHQPKFLGDKIAI